MDKIMFTIERQADLARTGKLLVNGRQVETPALVYPAELLEYISADTAEKLGVQALKVAGMSWWLRYDEQQLEVLGDLHQILKWNKLLFVDPETKVAYQNAKPRGVKKDGVRFHDQVGQLRFYQPTDGQKLQTMLGADINLSFSRYVDYFAPVDDLTAGIEQSIAWLPQTTALQQKGVGLITGGGLRHLRQRSIKAVTDLNFAGYGLAGIPDSLRDTEFQRIIVEIIQFLKPDPVRYLLTSTNFQQLLIAISSGMDLIDSRWIIQKALNGIALDFTNHKELRLSQTKFAFDHTNLVRCCQCPTCQAGYQRADLHQLVLNHAPFGEQLLLIHNLYTMNNFMKIIRQAIYDQKLTNFYQE